jgi:hypothetical protein
MGARQAEDGPDDQPPGSGFVGGDHRRRLLRVLWLGGNADGVGIAHAPTVA